MNLYNSKSDKIHILHNYFRHIISCTYRTPEEIVFAYRQELKKVFETCDWCGEHITWSRDPTKYVKLCEHCGGPN